MSKGLYHCSRCKSHFYDAEATAMHIRDKHKGEGEVLRHPTKKELLIRDEQQRARIEALEDENAQLKHAAVVREERVAELEAENKALSAAQETHLETIAELEAENARLCEVLRKIAGNSCVTCSTDAWNAVRAALKGDT